MRMMQEITSTRAGTTGVRIIVFTSMGRTKSGMLRMILLTAPKSGFLIKGKQTTVSSVRPRPRLTSSHKREPRLTKILKGRND